MKFLYFKLFWISFVAIVTIVGVYGYFVNSHISKDTNQNSYISEEVSKIIDYNVLFPYSELAKGMTYGDDSGVPKKIKDDFRKLGISHIMAVSGANIAILVSLISYFFIYFLGRKLMLIVIIPLIFLFIVLTGTEPSIIRASIMSIAGVLGLNFGRLSRGLYTLLFTAGIMILFEPSIATHNLGFQLSFLATFGIVVVYPFLNEKVSLVNLNSKILKNIIDAIFLTLSAQLATLVVIVPRFGLPSIFSIPANVFIAPISALIMIATLGIVVMHFISSFMAGFFGFIVYGLALLMLKLTNIFI